MSGQHNQQPRQQHQQQQQQQHHHRMQHKQASDRRSQIAARAENGQQLDDDQADEEEECAIEDQINQQQQDREDKGCREIVQTKTGTDTLVEVRAQARSASYSESEQSVALSEQVITSLQVNSKKAVEPLIKNQTTKETVAAASTTDPLSPPTTTTISKKDASSNNKRTIQNSRNANVAKHVLDPSGSLYYHWSMVVSFAFLYNFWSLSYRFAFREIDFDTVAFWFALDYSADIIYILDVVINSRTGYLEDGVLQRNKDKISVHYRECTLFYLDCFCLLPLDILYLSIGFNSILRCTRLVKIYKFWSYVDRTERHTNYPNVFRTFTLVHYILVIFHWNACLFHMISKSKIIDIEDLYKINDNRCIDVLCQYLHAFYWSTLALTTIGDLPRPRTKGEYVFVIVELFFGLFLFASVLGHVANIVTNVSAARKEFQAKLDAVKTFMRMRRVSDELQSKVIRWFDYLWISQKSSDEDRSVACLPDRLKAEIAIHVHLDTLKRVDIFQNTEAGFLCELVLRLKPVLFSPGDYVCRKNEVGHEMYIVSRGILEVVTDEGKTVVATLKAGSYFGEISVLNVGLAGNKRTASVRSVGYSDLFCLNKQDLWDVLKNYPNAEARIRARAEERLNKLDINQSRSSGLQTSAKMGSSLKSSKLKGICDIGITTSETAAAAANGSTRVTNQRKQRNIARSNLNNRYNKKQYGLWHQSHQNSCYSNLFDHYRYDNATNHHKCCLSNQTSLKYKPVCDNTMMSIINDNNQESHCNRASGLQSKYKRAQLSIYSLNGRLTTNREPQGSSQESLSNVFVACSDDVQNMSQPLQAAGDNNLIQKGSVEETESPNDNNKEMDKNKNRTDPFSKTESQQQKQVKQRRRNYPTLNSEQCNRNIPSRLLSGSISSGLDRDRQFYQQHIIGSKLYRQDQALGCEQAATSKCCRHQYSMDDDCSIASNNRAMDLRRHLNRRIGKSNQLVKQRQHHHSYCCDDQNMGQVNEMATTCSRRQPIVSSSSAIIAGSQQPPPSLWLPNQLPIYATQQIETMPQLYQEQGTSRAIGPIIQVPMLATPAQDGRFQYLQPIVASNSTTNPQSVSMTHLNIGSSLDFQGQVSPRSTTELEGQYLFNKMTMKDQLCKSSQSFQVNEQTDARKQADHDESQINMRLGRTDKEEEESNPRQTTSIDGSLESEFTAGGGTGNNLKLEEYSRNQPTNGADSERQFRIEISEPVSNGAKLPESGQSSNDLSELPFENLNKDPTG